MSALYQTMRKLNQDPTLTAEAIVQPRVTALDAVANLGFATLSARVESCNEQLKLASPNISLDESEQTIARLVEQRKLAELALTQAQEELEVQKGKIVDLQKKLDTRIAEIQKANAEKISQSAHNVYRVGNQYVRGK